MTIASACATALAASVVAGGHQSLLLRDDGTLWAWGSNSDGSVGDGTTANRSTPVFVLSDVKAFAAGNYQTLAVKADGTLWSWGGGERGELGNGSYAKTFAPGQVMTGVRGVAAGLQHSLAVKTDGTVWAWGVNTGGQLGDGTTNWRAIPAQVPGLSGVHSVAAGTDFSLALKSDGTLWAWGKNDLGQLGDGTTITRLQPVLVTIFNGAQPVKAIAAGYHHALAITNSGLMYSWGSNAKGALGDNTLVAFRASPEPWLSGVQAVSAGDQYSLAILTNGKLMAWGNNANGTLGDGTTIDRPLPVEVAASARAIAAGGAHSLVIRSDDTIWASGINGEGQLGDGATVNSIAPVLALTGGQAVSGGFSQALALRTDGTLLEWGGGIGAEPVTVLTGVKAASFGGFHFHAIKTDGTLWGQGSNDTGQLGDGTTSYQPIPVAIISGIRSVAGGIGHSLAITTDGTLLAWGDNTYGQLGDGTTARSLKPKAVMSGVLAASAGWNHSLAIKTDGTLWAWGQNAQGQLGDGTVADRAVPVRVMSGVKAVSAGYLHTLALKTDGTLWTWGYNSVGHLGDGTTTSRAQPVQVLTDVIAIAGGYGDSMAIKNDGTVWAWGFVSVPGASDAMRLTPQPHPFLRNATGIAAGGKHLMALTAAGHVVVWGANESEQLAVPGPRFRATPTAVRDPMAANAGSDVVTEFFNPTVRNGAGTPGIGHYFITAAAVEAASIDAGGSGPGWARTGRTFRAWNDPAKAPAAAVGVCRFYARVPNSHFYTASASECQSLKSANPTNDANLGWSYEGIAFYTVIPAGGPNCPAGYHPVYRSYNNRFNGNPALNDGNHRITPSYNDHQRSIRFFGYADEGIAFCSPVSASPGGDLQVTYSYPGATMQGGAPVAAEYLFGNNGPGSGDGGTIYLALPAEVANWRVSCTARNGATCPATADLDLLREGRAIATWPAGGTLTLKATGTAPQVTTGGKATLKFAATIANASGSPDSTTTNDMPPFAQMVLKAAAVCNTVLNPTSMQLGPAAQTPHVSLVIGAGCAWSAQSSAPWLTLTPSSNTGDATLSLALEANPAVTARSGTITLAGKTVSVTQSGIPCTFAAAPATLDFTQAAQARAVALTAPAGCNWSATSSDAWLTVSPANGSGNASLTIAAQANAATTARSGAIRLGNLTIPVTQSAAAQVAAPASTPADPCASLRLSRGTGEQVSARGFTGAQSFDVIADGQCGWRARSNDKWITLTAGAGGGGSGAVRYLVDEYFDLPTRQGTISVGDRTFTINQLGIVAGDQSSDSGGDGGSGGGGDGGSGSGGGDSGGGSG